MIHATVLKLWSKTPPKLARAYLVTELNARRALGSHVNAVQNGLSALPSFGGVWFKQAGNGVIAVGLWRRPGAS
jgi:hypothetical protein